MDKMFSRPFYNHPDCFHDFSGERYAPFSMEWLEEVYW
jgi:hypothetical protein